MILVDVLLFKDPGPILFRIRVAEKFRIRNTGQNRVLSLASLLLSDLLRIDVWWFYPQLALGVAY